MTTIRIRVASITTPIMVGDDLAKNVGVVATAAIPEPPKELTAKQCWTQCTLKNETQFNIVYRNSHHESGSYLTDPTNCNKFRQMVWSAYNNSGNEVSGGTAFRILLDDQNSYDFSLGWMTPLAGPSKAGVVESGNAEDGSDAAVPGGGAVQTKTVYEGKDAKKETAKFGFQVSAAPGSKALFVVKQVPVQVV